MLVNEGHGDNLVTDDGKFIVHDEEVFSACETNVEMTNGDATRIVVRLRLMPVAPIFEAFLVENVNLDVVATATLSPEFGPRKSSRSRQRQEWLRDITATRGQRKVWVSSVPPEAEI
jgi:hypothetical protein